jgi:3-hydroxybutyryl-CoA dehydrogenase
MKILIVGAGTMGSGIAQLVASCGYDVTLVDVSEEFLSRGMSAVEKTLSKLVEKGKITGDEKGKILGRIKTHLSLEDVCRDADFVIEAVIEDMALKRNIFKTMDACAGNDVILATNTSSLSITEIASATKRPDKVIGMHFFNPAPVMKLVELIRGSETSDETLRKTEDLSHALGKETVVVNESPGFVTTRMVAMIINEGAYMLQENLATREDIDKAIQLGLNHPMGPLKLADLIGVEVAVYILDYMLRETGDPKYKACPLLRKMVRAGHVGMKAGKGFYEYR